MTKDMSYAEIVRLKMKTGGPDGQRYSIREVARRTGYCYEHIRKIVNGEPVASKELNDRISELFGLNTDQMWLLAAKEKTRRKFGDLAMELPKNKRIAELWPLLTLDQQQRIVRLMEGYMAMNEAEAMEQNAPVPATALAMTKR